MSTGLTLPVGGEGTCECLDTEYGLVIAFREGGGRAGERLSRAESSEGCLNGPLESNPMHVVDYTALPATRVDAVTCLARTCVAAA